MLPKELIFSKYILFRRLSFKNIYIFYTLKLQNRKYDLIVTTYKYPTDENERIIFNSNFTSYLKFILLSQTKNIIVIDDNLVQHLRLVCH